MIIDLIIPGTDMWKYVGDSTISETVMKSEVSKVPQAVDELATQASADKFQLNETKCKELRITFSHSRKNFDLIKVNGQDLECVEQTMILGLQISSDLTWNNHVSEVVKKVNKRLYFLRQLKRAQVNSEELLLFCLTCIRPGTEYACPLYHHTLRHSGKMSAHAPEICDSSVNRLRMLHFNRQIHICYHNIFFGE